VFSLSARLSAPAAAAGVSPDGMPPQRYHSAARRASQRQ
jgi:hypothetical protein